MVSQVKPVAAASAAVVQPALSQAQLSQNLMDQLQSSATPEDHKQVMDALEKLISSASMLNAEDTQSSGGVRLTKEEIAKQEAFLAQEKKRIAMEEQMLQQQEKMKKEIEAKQQEMVKKVIEKAKKENEERQKREL